MKLSKGIKVRAVVASACVIASFALACEETMEDSRGRQRDAAVDTATELDAVDQHDAPVADVVVVEAQPDTAAPDTQEVCSSNAACEAKSTSTPFCNTTSKLCEECLDHGDCADGNKPLCEDGVCVACNAAEVETCANRNANTAVCQNTTGRCLGCLESADCTVPATPICRSDTYTCTACKADPECVSAKGAEPGVCLSHLDGRCATATDVVYAKNDTQALPVTCLNDAAGSVSNPFCSIQNAITEALATNKPAVVLRGGQAQFSFNQVGKTLLVVGQQGAILAPGFAGSAISATAGNLWVRGIGVEDSRSVGVSASGANTQLHLQNMVITGNAGGVLIDGAGFSIENTIVADNKVGQSGEASFGGILIRNPPAAGPKRLIHVTVVENKDRGIVSSSTNLEGIGLAISNPGHADIFGGTTLSACCSGPLNLSPTWRLTSASTACLNKVPAAMSLPFDIDNKARPQGAQSDCGASEYVP